MASNPADPKWLELLKATGWQNLGLAVACAAFIYLVKTHFIPATDDPLWIAIPTIGALICSGLAVAAGASSLTGFLTPIVRRQFSRSRYRKMVKEFIPHMTAQDRAIIGYLLYHIQKTFQTISDGGYAAPLIGKGIIRIAAVSGQHLDMNWVPFEIVEDAWIVLSKEREPFPYQPPASGEKESHPWAIPWMVR